MINYFNYFTEIEEHFVRRRGKNLMVAPLDWCLIELWKENGIPLHVVLRGIDRSFESAGRRASSGPRTLFYCHPGVMEAFEEYREAMLGTSDEERTAGDPRHAEVERRRVLSHLASLQEALQRRPGDVFQRAAERIRELIREVSSSPVLTLSQIDRDLATAGELVARQLAEAMEPEDLKSVRTEVRAELKRYRKRLGADMYRRLEQTYFERRIRESSGVPEFSLLEASSE